MKSLSKSLAIALFTAVIMGSCEKDNDDSETSKNELVVAGITYNLQTPGLLVNYGFDEANPPNLVYNGTNFDLYIMTEGVTPVYDSNGFLDSTFGNGHVFYFESFSSDSTKLANGTYNYNVSLPYPTGTFDLSYYTNGDMSYEIDIVGGSFSVSYSNSTYAIAFDLTDAKGKKITGNYTGKLNMADLK